MRTKLRRCNARLMGLKNGACARNDQESLYVIAATLVFIPITTCKRFVNFVFCSAVWRAIGFVHRFSDFFFLVRVAYKFGASTS